MENTEKVSVQEDDEENRIDINKTLSKEGILRDTNEEPTIESDSPIKSSMDFTEFGLKEEILRGVYDMQYNRPSKIQGLAIPAILKNPPKDFIGQAQSGTGKTAAFLLSMIARVDETLQQPQCLCVGPTRELVRQIYDVAVRLSKHTQVKVLLDVPEEKLPRVINQHIIIGTPGRIFNSVVRNKLNIKHIKMFVLDEADEMLKIQNQQIQTQTIHKKLPKDCQVCLFSATFNEEVRKLSSQVIKEPKIAIYIKPEELSVEKLIQTKIDCGNEEYKKQVLNDIFAYVNVGQCIIFTQTTKKAMELYTYMKEQGHEVSLLHGKNMQPKIRDSTIASFRQGKNRILISTNVLARGVDVLQVSLVINYDIPLTQDNTPDPETYLHRIGRTARYSNPGLAINFVHDHRSQQNLRIIQNHFNKPIEEIPLNKLEKISDILDKMNTYEKYNKND